MTSAATKPHFPSPCMVCGKPAELCVPLTICEECKNKPEAEIIRLKHKAWFWKLRADYQSDEIDALEIYLEAMSAKNAKRERRIEEAHKNLYSLWLSAKDRLTAKENNQLEKALALLTEAATGGGGKA